MLKVGELYTNINSNESIYIDEICANIAIICYPTHKTEYLEAWYAEDVLKLIETLNDWGWYASGKLSISELIQ